MTRIILILVLASFCLQGLHFAELPTPIKPFMFVVSVGLLWSITKLRFISRVSPVEMLSGLFLTYMVLSTLWAADTDLAILKSGGIVLLVISYYVLRSTMSSVKSKDLFDIISIGGLTVLVLSLIYYLVGVMLLDASSLVDEHEGLERLFLGAYLEGYSVRMRGLFDSPNNLALICMFLFLFYDFHKSKFSRVGKYLVVICLILTISLTGWISLIVAYISGFAFERRFKELFLVVVGIVAFVFLTLGVVPSDITDEILDSREERVLTGSGRVDLFELALTRIAEKPIFGHGLNQSRNILRDGRGTQSTHNSILEATIDGGFIGFAIYLTCWILYLVLAFRLSRVSRTPFYLSSALGLFVFSQSNLLTFVEIEILYFALWFEIADRSPQFATSDSSVQQSELQLSTKLRIY